MTEALVFESRTRPGRWFWLATNGQHGWTPTEADAWQLVNRHNQTRDAV